MCCMAAWTLGKRGSRILFSRESVVDEAVLLGLAIIKQPAHLVSKKLRQQRMYDHTHDYGVHESMRER